MVRKIYKRLEEMRVTARGEFDRLMRGGPVALSHFPEQHADTVAEVLNEYGLTLDHSRDLICDFGMRFESGNVITPLCKWTTRSITLPDRLQNLPERGRFALMLAHLVMWLSETPCRISVLPHIAQIAFHTEVLRAW